MQVRKKVTYISDNGFEFNFEPIEDSIKIVETEKEVCPICNKELKHITIKKEDVFGCDTCKKEICRKDAIKEKGFEVRYLIQDNISDNPDIDDNNLFLVNYHRDFWIERDNIITKDDVMRFYKDEKIEQLKKYHIFILSCYIHSGVSLSLGYNRGTGYTSFDTSHVGIVLVAREEAKTRKRAEELAQGLIETYNQWLSGDIYCLVKETYDKDKNKIDYDTLGGFYGYDEAIKALETDI